MTYTIICIYDILYTFDLFDTLYKLKILQKKKIKCLLYILLRVENDQ